MTAPDRKLVFAAKTRIRACVFATLFVVGLLAPSPVEAGGFAPISVRYGHFTSTRIAETADGGDYEVAFFRLRSRLQYPAILAQGRTVIINGISQDSLFLGYRDGGPPRSEGRLTNLHAVTYELTWRQEIGDRWRSVLTLRPGLSSDFRAISGDDVLVRGAAIVSYEVNDDLQLGLGTGYSTAFGAARFLPLLEIDWHHPSGWRLEALLPRKLELVREVSRLVAIGFAGQISGNVYHLNDPALEDRDTARFAIGTVGFLGQYCAHDVELNGGLRGGIFVDLEVGMTFLRRFEAAVFDESLSPVGFGENFFGRLEVALRF